MAIYDATFGGHPFDLRLNISSSEDINSNASTVSWNLQIIKTTNNTPDRTDNAATWAFNYGGSGHFGPYSFNGAVGQTLTIASGTFVVAHNADGTAPDLALSFSANAASTITTAAGGGSFPLPTIPRASTPTFSPSPMVAGSPVTISTNPASDTFVHELDYSFGSQSGVIATGVASSQSWTPPLSLLNEIPNSASGAGTITCTTYASDGTTVIGTSTIPFTLNVPDTAIPTISSITASEAVALVNTAVGKYVQGLSKLNLAIVGAAGVDGSTITSYKLTVAGQTINAVSGTTGVITQSGALTVIATVTDSRGRVGTATLAVNVLPYAVPSINTAALVLSRVNADGTPNENGTYIKVAFSAAVQSLPNGAAEKNALTFRLSTRQNGTTVYTAIDTETPGGLTFNGSKIIAGYAAESSWDVLLEVADIVATTGVVRTVATSIIFMDWNGSAGLGLNKFHEHGFLDVGGDIYQNGNKVIDTSTLPVASTTVQGVAELAVDADAIAGTDTTKIVTPHAAAAAFNAKYAAYNHGRKNAIINGNFRTNQRAYASGSSIPLGTYCFDRWRASGRVNLVFNPAARSATTGWSNIGASTLSQITGLTIPGLAGVTTAARLTFTGTGSGQGIAWLGSQTSPYTLVTAGQTYTFSMWVRSSVAQSTGLSLNLYTSGGALVTNMASTQVFALAANTWTRVYFTATMPATVARAGMYTASAGSIASGTTMDATGALVESGNTVLPYFDGTFTGCGWSSTPNASSSYIGSSLPAAPTVTFTAAPQGQVVTLSASGAIAQVIEQANVVAAPSVLSWSGTSTARIYNKGALSSALPAFAASPIAYTPDGTDDLVIEFSNSGSVSTLSNAQFEVGTIATAYEYIPVSEERGLCQHYYWKTVFPDGGQFALIGFATNTTNAYLPLGFTMRTGPLVSYSNLIAASTSGSATVAGGMTAYAASDSLVVQFGTTGGLVANGGAFLNRNTAGVPAYIALDADF